MYYITYLFIYLFIFKIVLLKRVPYPFNGSDSVHDMELTAGGDGGEETSAIEPDTSIGSEASYIQEKPYMAGLFTGSARV